MHRNIINILNWYSLSLRKVCNNLRSYRFKKLEQKRINMLVTKYESLKHVFVPESLRRPELKYNVGMLYKFNDAKMSTHRKVESNLKVINN